ncbi:MAG: multidrug transporter [Flavobacteriaceae bacterium]|nr:MAG: multidrug transporter [Flavobacteriaceae bacterium]
MKNTIKIAVAFLAIFTVSCADDDTSDIIINATTTNNVTNNNGAENQSTSETIYLSGTYVEDLSLEASNTYILNGALVMTQGTTLNIEAGTVIKALAAGSDIYVAIAQGATINAVGTVSKPIVFTSDAAAPKAGDWGGLILLGKAPINSVTGGDLTSTSEIGALPYGGSVVADNSGTLKYVRVEYSGGKADGQSENNGFSFYGVGNATRVSYIQMFEGLDDGIEFFGGTVNVSFLSVVNAQDDSIDWTEGYSGNITNAYVKHGENHDKGIEADGFNTDIGNNSNTNYFSAPTVSNVTIVGLGSSDGGEAVRLRAGTQGVFSNFKIIGFKEGFDLDGDDTTSPTGKGVVDGVLKVEDITFTDVTLKMKNDTGFTFTEADFISGDGNGTGTDYATWGAGWTVE